MTSAGSKEQDHIRIYPRGNVMVHVFCAGVSFSWRVGGRNS